MTAPFATLPMYDWPEVRPAVDRVWAAIRAGLEAEGLPAPRSLSRPDDLYAAWADDDLLVGQTCGFPLVQTLSTVEVIGAFDHRLPDTPAGWYHSAIVVAADDDVSDLDQLRGATVAVNGADSQSGHAVWRHELHARDLTGPFFADVLVSGGHRHSIRAVAEGRARAAAIDALSLHLAESHEPSAEGVRVLARTDPTPGLPLITNSSNADLLPALRRAVAAAIHTLDPADRDALGIHGFVPLSRDDYAMVKERWIAADAVPALA